MTDKQGLGDGEALRQVCTDIASAMAACHAAATAHRDMKPENFLFFTRSSGSQFRSDVAGANIQSLMGIDGHTPMFTAKLADFGCATHSATVLAAGEKHLWCTDTPGSVSYRPPEMHVAVNLQGDAAPLRQAAAAQPALHNFASYDAFAGDVWSWAVAMYVMASGRIPFHEAHIRDGTFVAFLHATQPWAVTQHPAWSTMHALGLGAARTVRWRWPRHFSPALKDLLASCLKLDPSQRPTAQQVLQHPWMQPQHHQEPMHEMSISSISSKSMSLPPLPLAGVPVSSNRTGTHNCSMPLSGSSSMVSSMLQSKASFTLRAGQSLPGSNERTLSHQIEGGGSQAAPAVRLPASDHSQLGLPQLAEGTQQNFGVRDDDRDRCHAPRAGGELQAVSTVSDSSSDSSTGDVTLQSPPSHRGRAVSSAMGMDLHTPDAVSFAPSAPFPLVQQAAAAGAGDPRPPAAAGGNVVGLAGSAPPGAHTQPTVIPTMANRPSRSAARRMAPCDGGVSL